MVSSTPVGVACPWYWSLRAFFAELRIREIAASCRSSHYHASLFQADTEFVVRVNRGLK